MTGISVVPTKMPARHDAHFDWQYPADHPELQDGHVPDQRPVRIKLRRLMSGFGHCLVSLQNPIKTTEYSVVHGGRYPTFGLL